MAIAAFHLTTDGNETDQTSYTTASISPTANRLVILTVRNAFSTGPNTPTVSGAGMTWTQITTAVDAGNIRRVTMFRALAASPGSGALTIDLAGQSQINCNWSISEFSGIVTTGTNGADAVVQSNTNTANATNTGLTVTLSAFGSTNNASHGVCIKNASNVPVAGSGFTELASYTTVNKVESEWQINDNTVDWTWASESNISQGVAIEMQALSQSLVKKVGGIAVGSISKISGVSLASIKKLAGVTSS